MNEHLNSACKGSDTLCTVPLDGLKKVVYSV